MNCTFCRVALLHVWLFKLKGFVALCEICSKVATTFIVKNELLCWMAVLGEIGVEEIPHVYNGFSLSICKRCGLDAVGVKIIHNENMLISSRGHVEESSSEVLVGSFLRIWRWHNCAYIFISLFGSGFGKKSSLEMCFVDRRLALFWSRCYFIVGIRFCNTFLKLISSIPGQDMKNLDGLL